MYLTCITITQSTIITSPTGFNVGLTNVDARLKQRCINVVPTLCNIVSTLCNVVSTLFERRALMLYQYCATLKIRRRILFHFQSRINVISTLIHNVETTLIRRWNVGWERSSGARKDNPSLYDFDYNDNTIRNQKVFKPIATGNVRDEHINFEIDAEPVPCRKKYKQSNLWYLSIGSLG